MWVTFALSKNRSVFTDLAVIDILAMMKAQI